MIDKKNLILAERVFKILLSSPHRRVLNYIIQNQYSQPPKSVTNMYCDLRIDQSGCSFSLIQLRRIGAVFYVKKGKEHHYYPSVKMLEYIDEIAADIKKNIYD